MHKGFQDKEDSLIHFIDQNREEFDDEVPSSSEIWNKIEQRIEAPKKGILIRFRPLFKYAAAAVFLMVFGAAVWILIDNRKQPVDPALSMVQKYYPDYADQVVKFTNIVEKRQEELKKIGTKAPGIYKNFTTDLDELDSVNSALKKDLNTYPNKEDVLIALIENLKMQADVLNQQLHIIRNLKKDSHEIH